MIQAGPCCFLLLPIPLQPMRLCAYLPCPCPCFLCLWAPTCHAQASGRSPLGFKGYAALAQRIRCTILGKVITCAVAPSCNAATVLWRHGAVAQSCNAATALWRHPAMPVLWHLRAMLPPSFAPTTWYAPQTKPGQDPALTLSCSATTTLCPIHIICCKPYLARLQLCCRLAVPPPHAS